MSLKAYITDVETVTRESIASHAYLYPLKGVTYFIKHPSLYPPLASRIVPCTILALSVTISMFTFTYIPQAAALAFVNGPLGPINAIALVLSESTAIVTVLARSFLLKGALTDLFDATLLSEGQDSLVAKGREVKNAGDRHGVHRLGREIMKPLDKYVITLIMI